MKYIVFAPDREIISYYTYMADAKRVAKKYNGSVEKNYCFTSKRLVQDFRYPEVRAWQIDCGYC